MRVSKRLVYYLVLLALSVIYIVASLSAPLGPNRFNLTPSKTHILQLTILLPVVLIWVVAAYGAERFITYTDSIKKDKDGAALGTVSTGLIILVGSIVATSLLGVLRPWAMQDNWLAAFTVASNFLSAALPLIGYGFVFAGSYQLSKLTKVRPSGFSSVMLAIALVALGILYIVVLINYPYANHTPDPNKYSSFYMSDPLIILTIALPYLIGWGLAIKAALNINLYRRAVKGVIYKAALLRLVIGISTVVFFYIIVQLLVAFSTFLATAGLSSLLLLIYLLLAIYGFGFLVIALGAKKLTQIEKVL